MIDISIALSSPLSSLVGSTGERPGEGASAFCWLLVYDARLEHVSPLPQLAKRIYESVREASRALAVGEAPSARDKLNEPPWRGVAFGAVPMPVAAAPMADGVMPQVFRAAATLAAAPAALFAGGVKATAAEAEAPPAMAVAPTRM